MQCPQCQHENSATARFCEECGQLLRVRCPACGFEPTPSAQLPRVRPAPDFPCTSRGEPGGLYPLPGLHAAASGREDFNVSQRPGGRAQAGHGTVRRPQGLYGTACRPRSRGARQILDPVLERLMAAVHRYEGTVNQVMGDGIMALFGAPVAHEDHAVRACYAALAMQEAMRRYAEEVRRRHGLAVQSGWASTPETWWCGLLATTCTWTTRPLARPPTWRRAWSSSPAWEHLYRRPPSEELGMRPLQATATSDSARSTLEEDLEQSPCSVTYFHRKESHHG